MDYTVRTIILGFALCLVLSSAGACMPAASDKIASHQVGGRSAEAVFEPTLARLANAACNGDSNAINAALAQGADPNGQGREGVTPLLWAINCENAEGVEALLQHGANANMELVTSRGAFTPVFAAVRNRHPAVLRSLLRHGGNPNSAFSTSPWTALSAAYGWGLETRDWSNYYALLSAGADINRSHNGETVAEFQASLNDWQKVSELLDRGYSSNLQVIARFAATADPSIMDDSQERFLAQVRLQLQAKGVNIPVATARNPNAN